MFHEFELVWFEAAGNDPATPKNVAYFKCDQK